MNEIRSIYSAEPPPPVPDDLKALAEAEYAAHCFRNAIEVVCSGLDWSERRRVRAFLDMKYPGVGRFVPEGDV